MIQHPLDALVLLIIGLFLPFLKIQEVWDDVRLQLRRHLLDRLSPRSPEHPEAASISTLSIPDQVHCLQQLFFLYPESEVLTHYQVCSNSRIVFCILLCFSPYPQCELAVPVWCSSILFYIYSPASERSVCAGSSSLCPELKPRRRDWLWQTGYRLPFRGPGSHPSPHGWAPCPFKTSGTSHHPGFSKYGLPQHHHLRTRLADGERMWDSPEGQHHAQQQD